MSDRHASPPLQAGADDLSATIDAALKRGAMVLTPNLRTARHLSAAYDDARRAEGLPAWQPADTLSWAAWTSLLWREALVAGIETRVLLNDLQERAIWQRVLRESAPQSLRPLSSQARLCSGALRLLAAYDVEGRFARLPVEGAASDAATFADWHGRFTELCRQDGLLPSSYLDVELAALLREKTIAPASEYLVYGFDRLTPSQRSVTDALQQSGSKVLFLEPLRPGSVPPQLMRCADPEAELQMCCEWIRNELIAKANAQIALIVPDLESVRPELERMLRATIAPGLADVTAGEQLAPYEFSTGRPLSQITLAADAMRVLRWCAGPLSIADAGAVLCSEHLSLALTPERGAELDAFVLRESRLLRGRAGLRGEITLSGAAAVIGSRDEHTSSSLRRLASAVKSVDKAPKSHAFFADETRKFLAFAGWPGRSDLSSVEYQAVDRWDDMLDRLSTLDLLGARITFSAFVDDLVELARETIFAPENAGAPVQVLTVTEAAGSTADALWFLHADDATWPPHRSPHPLLPWSFQQSLGIPGSDTARDEDEARQSTERCLRSAGKAVFSYAASHAAGHRRPSPLVEALPGIAVTTATSAEVLVIDAQVETVQDELPLPLLPDKVAAGGVSVLTAQAQCGFRAFAERRLFLRDLESIDAGLSPRDRGDQIHVVLQSFWKEVGSQAELLRISKRDSSGSCYRDTLLRRCIQEVFDEAPAHAWDAAYLDVQRTRLFRLLSDWLDTESRRPPFTVLHTEYEVQDTRIGPLRIDMRVDRIDQVGSAIDGTEAVVLIDYKTGTSKVERKDWLGERPDAPQLPLYAVASGTENVRGIAFGSVRVGKDGNRFDDMTDQPLLGNKVKKDFVFDDQVAEWKRDLTKLAEAYAQGEAGLDPKDHRITCKHCAQRLLCRLDLMKLEADDDLLEEDEEDVPAW